MQRAKSWFFKRNSFLQKDFNNMVMMKGLRYIIKGRRSLGSNILEKKRDKYKILYHFWLWERRQLLNLEKWEQKCYRNGSREKMVTIKPIASYVWDGIMFMKGLSVIWKKVSWWSYITILYLLLFGQKLKLFLQNLNCYDIGKKIMVENCSDFFFIKYGLKGSLLLKRF